MLSPKPHPIRVPARWPQQPKVQRLPVRNRMTIALGMICQGGLVIAADTRLSTLDGTSHDACKVQSKLTPSGAFVVAYSSENSNAGEALANEVISDLATNDRSTLVDFESDLRATMGQWYADFREEPQTLLIIGAYLERSIALYFCQPPNPHYS